MSLSDKNETVSESDFFRLCGNAKIEMTVKELEQLINIRANKVLTQCIGDIRLLMEDRDYTSYKYSDDQMRVFHMDQTKAKSRIISKIESLGIKVQ